MVLSFFYLTFFEVLLLPAATQDLLLLLFLAIVPASVAVRHAPAHPACSPPGPDLQIPKWVLLLPDLSPHRLSLARLPLYWLLLLPLHFFAADW